MWAALKKGNGVVDYEGYIFVCGYRCSMLGVWQGGALF